VGLDPARHAGNGFARDIEGGHDNQHVGPWPCGLLGRNRLWTMLASPAPFDTPVTLASRHAQPDPARSC
jgi:hypothetical protein